jgi:predicted  nucleic acid-binding Zn-ribbon protein
MIDVEINALKDFHASLGRIMIEGTHQVQEIKAKLSGERSQFEDKKSRFQRIVEECQEFKRFCEEQLQMHQQALADAQQRLAEARQLLEDAKANYYACLNQPYDSETGPPNCNQEQYAVQVAEQSLYNAEVAVETCRENVYRSEEALNRARDNLYNVEQSYREFEYQFSEFQQHEQETLQQCSQLTAFLNYEIPHERDMLGYKISVLERDYLRSVGDYAYSDHQSYSYRKARKQFLEEAIYDYRLPRYIRAEIKQNIGNARHGYIRSPQGFDVGHRFQGINAAYNFRLEGAAENRARGGRYRR